MWAARCGAVFSSKPFLSTLSSQFARQNVPTTAPMLIWCNQVLGLVSRMDDAVKAGAEALKDISAHMGEACKHYHVTCGGPRTLVVVCLL
jgi:hypothetical protein